MASLKWQILLTDGPGNERIHLFTSADSWSQGHRAITGHWSLTHSHPAEVEGLHSPWCGYFQPVIEDAQPYSF